MRKAISKIGTACAIAALTASAGVAVGQGTAAADPAAGHKVVYTLTTGGSEDFNLFYLTTQPPSKAAYDTDSYSFVKNESVPMTAGVPWTFETTLADQSWAILTATSTHHGGRDAPNPSCEISVDGQVVAHQEDPYIVRCTLGQL
jgi:uncharacterized membrane protein